MNIVTNFIVEALIKDKDSYDWYVYNGPKVSLKYRNDTYILMKGSIYGVRPATSKKGVSRIILKDLGKNKVFSVEDKYAAQLIKKSKSTRRPIKLASYVETATKYVYTYKSKRLGHPVTYRDYGEDKRVLEERRKLKLKNSKYSNISPISQVKRKN